MRGYFGIGLDNPQTKENVGGVLRAAGVYGASFVTISNFNRNIHKLKTDTIKAYRHIPVFTVENLFSNIPLDTELVAVEILPDAKSLVNFCHPERALYIFGPENGSISKDVLDRCTHKVQIPTKYCMNLATTVNVVLYDRLAKQSK